MIHYIHLDSTDSTNNWVKREAHRLDPHQLTCITTDEQIQGRGRQGRHWFSPKGENIYASFFFPLDDETHLPNVAQLLSISCAKVLIHHTFKPLLKWPNDLFIKTKKVGGVLAESITLSDKQYVVAGLGLNVNMGQGLLSRIDQPATSLFIESGKHFSLPLLVQELSLQFNDDLDLFQQKGFAPFHSFYDKHLHLKGKKITVKIGDQTVKGICHSISEDGKLNLLLEDKSILTISSGDTQIS